LVGSFGATVVGDNPMTTTKRRWFRFSFATMFVVVTVVGCWLGYQLDWIRQRQDALAMPDVIALENPFADGPPIPAPNFLGIFGEQGQDELVVILDSFVERPLTQSEAERIQHISALFPEAKVEGRAPPRSERPGTGRQRGSCQCAECDGHLLAGRRRFPKVGFVGGSGVISRVRAPTKLC